MQEALPKVDQPNLVHLSTWSPVMSTTVHCMHDLAVLLHSSATSCLTIENFEGMSQPQRHVLLSQANLLSQSFSKACTAFECGASFSCLTCRHEKVHISWCHWSIAELSNVIQWCISQSKPANCSSHVNLHTVPQHLTLWHDVDVFSYASGPKQAHGQTAQDL